MLPFVMLELIKWSGGGGRAYQTKQCVVKSPLHLGGAVQNRRRRLCFSSLCIPVRLGVGSWQASFPCKDLQCRCLPEGRVGETGQVTALKGAEPLITAITIIDTISSFDTHIQSKK